MPTVIEPKVNESKPQLVVPTTDEPELFAAEIEMQGRNSSFLPIVLILGLLFVVGGTVFYVVKGARDVLTVPVATSTVTQILNSEATASVRFSSGTVVASVNEKPFDPQYKLLAKAGIVVTKPKGSTALIVNLTAPGEQLLAAINGVQKDKKSDGTTSYKVPLATRQLVSIDKVTMIKPHLATVDYTWKWEANRLGKEFDASGSLVQSFTTWDRATLIKSYGVDFYSGAPAKASIILVEGNNGTWKPYVE